MAKKTTPESVAASTRYLIKKGDMTLGDLINLIYPTGNMAGTIWAYLDEASELCEIPSLRRDCLAYANRLRATAKEPTND